MELHCKNNTYANLGNRKEPTSDGRTSDVELGLGCTSMMLYVMWRQPTGQTQSNWVTQVSTQTCREQSVRHAALPCPIGWPYLPEAQEPSGRGRICCHLLNSSCSLPKWENGFRLNHCIISISAVVTKKASVSSYMPIYLQI